jgi:hypothetical protein
MVAGDVVPRREPSDVAAVADDDRGAERADPVHLGDCRLFEAVVGYTCLDLVLPDASGGVIQAGRFLQPGRHETATIVADARVH